MLLASPRDKFSEHMGKYLKNVFTSTYRKAKIKLCTIDFINRSDKYLYRKNMTLFLFHLLMSFFMRRFEVYPATAKLIDIYAKKIALPNV